ncbi:MAG TPA: ferrous iron transport protein B [Candidatus Omnitrophota bacterium]|nr:ferrous iron transport protein B [Candidatus Omnitrophota bacterium]
MTTSPAAAIQKSAFTPNIRQFIIVGNPNVGKSVIFGLLANKYVTVSNYPGTTVTVTKGWMELPEGPIPLIDTPGVNNLTPNSEEEVVTRDIILSSQACDKVIQVLDTKNLKRGLFLTIQLSEMKSCAILALNMWDEAKLRGYELNIKKLEEIFGVPCVPTVAIQKKGVYDLKKHECRHFSYKIQYHEAIESALAKLSKLLPPSGISLRAQGLMVLSGDETFTGSLREKVSEEVFRRIMEIREQAEHMLNRDLRRAIDNARMAEAERISKLVLKQTQQPRIRRLWNGLERMTTHSFGGFVILCGILFLMHHFVGVLGAGVLVDLTENRLFNGIINPAMIRFFDFLMPFAHEHVIADGIVLPEYALGDSHLSVFQSLFRFVHDFFVGEYGAITMALTYGLAIIFPVVITFFLAFGILEDLGYLPRLSILLNRLFKTIGLNGKAVLPMMLGLGCDTMATVTTRILDTKKERIITTFLLALAVPCSAQLAVILFLLQGGIGMKGILVWVSIVVMVFFLAGWMASRLVPGDDNPLILEIPPLRIPSLRNIVLKTLARVEWYLKEVIPVFLIGTGMLFLLSELNLLALIERFLRPLVVGWLGLPSQSAEAILMGFFRRDYGAAGFIHMFEKGILDQAQILVGVTTITLFVPCVANALIMIKERGYKMAFAMFAIIMVMAFGVGGLLNQILQRGWIVL